MEPAVFWWSCVLGQDSHGRRVREFSLTICRWVGVGMFLFPGRRASTNWRDVVWTVVSAEVFLGTFVERSKTPFTMLRTLCDRYFRYFGCFLLISSSTVFQPLVDILMKI